VSDQINFRLGSIDDSTASADLVCANLTADVITQMLRTLVGLSCGKLILSGILETQIEMVQAGLHDCGIDEFEIAQDGEWVALISEVWLVGDVMLRLMLSTSGIKR